MTLLERDRLFVCVFSYVERLVREDEAERFRERGCSERGNVVKVCLVQAWNERKRQQAFTSEPTLRYE